MPSQNSTSILQSTAQTLDKLIFQNSELHNLRQSSMSSFKWTIVDGTTTNSCLSFLSPTKAASVDSQSMFPFKKSFRSFLKDKRSFNLQTVIPRSWHNLDASWWRDNSKSLLYNFSRSFLPTRLVYAAWTVRVSHLRAYMSEVHVYGGVKTDSILRACKNNATTLMNFARKVVSSFYNNKVTVSTSRCSSS